jgi:protoporphyrinogen/coproporphyrinogen III oxidase
VAGSGGRVTVVVIGGGIAGLAAARRLTQLQPESEIVLVERERRLGGKILTERTADGFVIEGGADSFLSRKERGVGLCEELGIELAGRRPEHARSFVRRGSELHPLPEGLSGTIPTDLDALASSALLSAEGKARVAEETDLPPAPPGGDESIASFVSRRLGREGYEAIVEPLLTGIYGGDGEQLSLEATFPQLRRLELEYGSVIRGLEEQPHAQGRYPPFVAPESGMGTIVERLVGSLERRVTFLLGSGAVDLRPRSGGFVVELWNRSTLDADGVVLAVPAFIAAPLLDGIDADWLAEEHYDMVWSSSAVVTVGYEERDVPHPLDGYGYLVPRTEGSDVLACTWTSSKWQGRAPAGKVLLRVFAGRFGSSNVTEDSDRALLKLARNEVRVLGIKAKPSVTRIHRWLGGMPQYVLGHPERLRRIDTHLAEHPGLALAGAAYRGVGIPDCIASGEEAAESVVRALTGARA